MPGIDPENLRIAIGWGVVAAVLVWLALCWAFPKEKDRWGSPREGHDDLRDREDSL